MRLEYSRRFHSSTYLPRNETKQLQSLWHFSKLGTLKTLKPLTNHLGSNQHRRQLWTLPLQPAQQLMYAVKKIVNFHDYNKNRNLNERLPLATNRMKQIVERIYVHPIYLLRPLTSESCHRSGFLVHPTQRCWHYLNPADPISIPILLPISLYRRMSRYRTSPRPSDRQDLTCQSTSVGLIGPFEYYHLVRDVHEFFPSHSRRTSDE